MERLNGDPGVITNKTIIKWKYWD